MLCCPTKADHLTVSTPLPIRVAGPRTVAHVAVHVPSDECLDNRRGHGLGGVYVNAGGRCARQVLGNTLRKERADSAA